MSAPNTYAKLDVKAVAYASAALWGLSMLITGLINLSVPDYGLGLLELLASLYPGYTAERSVESVLIGTGYALVDGAVLGWLLGWLYNRLVK
ncbi:MAG: hypothetical protein HYZ91_04710 [Candidatus Omnitrophica bacterium]|nr:hypothetical protein [Candidatus Omnitrophota bacterium]